MLVFLGMQVGLYLSFERVVENPVSEPIQCLEETGPKKPSCLHKSRIDMPKQQLAKKYSNFPILPIKNTVIFPGVTVPLVVGRKKSLASIDAASSREDKAFVSLTQKNSEIENPSSEDLYHIGTQTVIRGLANSSGGVDLFVYGIKRVKLRGKLKIDPFLQGKFAKIPEPKDTGADTKALIRNISSLLQKVPRLSVVSTEYRNYITTIADSIESDINRAFLIAAIVSFDVRKAQQILESETKKSLLQRLYDYLFEEVQILELQKSINNKAATSIGKAQRDIWLKQQLQAIQSELGEDDVYDDEIVTLRNKLEEAELPEVAKNEGVNELKKLERMPSVSSEFQMIRSYLELLLDLPWHKKTEDLINIEKAFAILNEDHFDLEDVKDRLLEHLAVLKRNPDTKSPILCLVGPPGTGKTSIGQSIARALGRKFGRMSLGGVHDESELRGHRRTYIASMPGRIIQAIRRAGVNNPLIMLDEIDKLGCDFRGDPSSTLLEILDPEQNQKFFDTYLNVPFDISNVLFITTANILDTIPRPLLDRMEIIRLSGYSDYEKVEIARKYLLPKQIKNSGLATGEFEISNEDLHYIIRGYSREAGVRELERLLGKLTRKIVLKISKAENFNLTAKGFDELLGPKKFLDQSRRLQIAAGTAIGLAWTEVGGSVLYIESALFRDAKEDLFLTGQLGEVMKESARTAFSYIKSQAKPLGIDEGKFQHASIHIHVPEGAIPKDGPSAGTTLATALASLFLEKPVRNDTAMTGETTLTGLIAPVSGIKEKVLAAHREGIKRIILPRENKANVRELPKAVSNDLEFVFVSKFEEVFEKIF